MRIDGAVPVAGEADQAEVAGFGERDGECGRRGDRRQQRDAGLSGFHRQFVAGAAGDDGEAIAGIEARALDLADGTRVVLDGTRGTLRTGVTDEEIEEIFAMVRPGVPVVIYP